MEPIQVQLDYGSSGPEVTKLQRFLQAQGYNVPEITGNFLGQTQRALQAYQSDRGIVSQGDPASTGYGRLGPMTLAQLNQEAQELQLPDEDAQEPTTGQQEDPEGQNQQPSGAQPYFRGDGAVVRFTGQGPQGSMDNTLWWVDRDSKTIRPFESAEAVRNFFGGDVPDNVVIDIPASELFAEGAFGRQGDQQGFTVLSDQYEILNDGTGKALDFSPSEIAARYGKEPSEEAGMEASMFLDGFLDLLQNTDSGISPSMMKSLQNDEDLVGFYINALAYGDYSLIDVYRDMKSRDLGLDSRPISPTMERDEYVQTQDYAEAISDNRTLPPQNIGGAISAESLDLAIYDLPPEAFKTLVPVLDIESDEFKDRMADIESAYHDILLKQIEANTEQEKAVADEQWREFREDLERTYGIKLSQNAFNAWDQIEGAYEKFAQRGLQGSGIAREAVDTYLDKVRRQDQQLRDERMSQEEKQERSYYLNYATPQQIRELVQNDPDKAKAWGLIPSDEMRESLSMEALREKYPEMSDEELATYRASILDENGNYRSDLFKRQIESSQEVKEAKKQFQQERVQQDILREEEKAYREFTQPGSPFLDAGVSGEDVKPYTQPTEEADETTDFSDRIRAAALEAGQQQQQPEDTGDQQTPPQGTPRTPPQGRTDSGQTNTGAGTGAGSTQQGQDSDDHLTGDTVEVPDRYKSDPGRLLGGETRSPSDRRKESIKSMISFDKPSSSTPQTSRGTGAFGRFGSTLKKSFGGLFGGLFN